jgi:hypothetical protein
MKMIGQLNQNPGGLSFLAFNGSELRNTGSNHPAAPKPAPVMATAAQVFGHGVLSHAASRRGRQITLPKDQVLRLEQEDVPTSIRVLSGVLWITEDGDVRDHVIQANSRVGNQRYQFTRRTGSTISALEDAELEVA